MKRISYIYILCAICFFSSCKSFKNLTAKDSSSSQRSKPANNNVVFLDNVSVTPGDERSSTLTSGSAKPTYTTRNTVNSNFNIESAQGLQIKYATVLDVPVEDLTNIPLLQDIDYWWGTRYCMGGSTQNCIDCSAFTQTIIKDIYSIQLPRTAEEQYNAATPLNYVDLKEGDLVFFQTSGRTISHVGVYIANNKFAHASTSGGVMISDLNEEYWKKRYRAAGRVKK